MNIANLNDTLRSQLPLLPQPHRFVMTSAVATLPPQTLSELFAKLRSFNSFNSSNDFYQEHDFVSIKHDGETFFLKVDCYDSNLEYYQPDGTRILTLMFSHEY